MFATQDPGVDSLIEFVTDLIKIVTLPTLDEYGYLPTEGAAPVDIEVHYQYFN